MFLGLSVPKLLLILAIGLLLFGGKRLPELGRALGQSIRGVKDGLAEEPVVVDEKKKEHQV